MRLILPSLDVIPLKLKHTLHKAGEPGEFGKNLTDAHPRTAVCFAGRDSLMSSGTSSVVLLIEPNDSSRVVYADALRNAGFTVVMAPDCAAGLYALTEITPQVLVASFHPRTHDECLAFCERLKSDSRTRAIPILLTSETINGVDLQRATDISVLGVSIGPQDGGKMTSAVRGVLAVADSRASMAQPDPHVSPPE